MTVPGRNFLLELFIDLLLLPLLAGGASIETAEDSTTPYNQSYVIALVVSVAVLIGLFGGVLFLCGDCYNSEVSSTSHPACGGNKWGGGDGYQVTATQDVNTSVMQSSQRFGEVVNPASGSQGLLYSMTSSHIQTENHFVGYGSAPRTDFSGLSGGGGGGNEPAVNMYGGGALQQGGGSQRDRDLGMHVNPMEDAPEEPPPSYREALRTGI